MTSIKISPIKSLKGEIEVPADKSISHRALIIGSLAQGKTVIKNFLHADDTLSTMRCLNEIGAKINNVGSQIVVTGQGQFESSEKLLDVGNSGTTIRMLLGVLSSQDFTSVITGDDSVQKRPMGRVMIPLTMMGAHFKVGDRELNIDELTKGKDTYYPPIEVIGGGLKGITYNMPVASAQVKSSILLAGIRAMDETVVIERELSRDHTEKMLEHFGANIKVENNKITIDAKNNLKGQEVIIPGDISSAAFFMVAAALVKDSKLCIKNVGLNAKRLGLLDVLKKMGAKFEIQNKKIISNEEVGDIIIRGSVLEGVEIGKGIVPKLIDEIPIIALAASLAKGETIISGAQELRVKESDRLKSIADGLKKFGADVEEKEDGLVINGKDVLQGTSVESYGDHRIAMTFVIAGLLAKGETTVNNIECINTSFPGFFDILDYVTVGL